MVVTRRLQTRFLSFSRVIWSSHSCNDHKYSHFTRSICNQCIDSLKIFFGATSKAYSPIVTIETRLKGGIKRQIEFCQPYQHKRKINQYVLFIYFSIGYRISHALPWSHLTSISAHLQSKNINKAYLKTRTSIEG